MAFNCLLRAMQAAVNNVFVRSIYVQRIDNLMVLVNESHNENFGHTVYVGFFALMLRKPGLFGGKLARNNIRVGTVPNVLVCASCRFNLFKQLTAPTDSASLNPVNFLPNKKSRAGYPAQRLVSNSM